MGCEATTHLSLVLKIKNVWNSTFTSPHIFMAWCLIKHMDNLNFTVQWVGITVGVKGVAEQCACH